MRTHRVWWWGTTVSLSLLFIITSLALAQETPTRPPMPRPTEDRLSAPPTVPSPTQADEGEQLYWLHCQPCHGDIGQGLTDEWRAEYPQDHQNCWKSGCHGERPYEEGFTLPDTVPAIIGGDSLIRFETFGQLFAFTRATMPFEYPGVLTDEEYLAVIAYLARANNIWDGTPLDEANVTQFRVNPLAEEAVQPQEKAGENHVDNEHVSSPTAPAAFIWGGSLMLLCLVTGVWLWRLRRQ